MTALRERMIEDMQLRGLSANTQEAYVRAVKQLAEYYHRSPEEISQEELRQYFLYLKNDKGVSRSTLTVALCAIKFFYQHTLQRQWSLLAFMRPPHEQKLPVVLSVEEVHRVLGLLAQAPLPSLLEHDLRLRSAAPRRGQPAGNGHRQQPHAGPRPEWERRQGSLRSAARTYPDYLARLLADPSAPQMALPGHAR